MFQEIDVTKMLISKFVKLPSAENLQITQCAWCEKYCTIDGQWVGKIELPFDHVVSHGICPDCKHKYFDSVLLS
jgi:hypothetical protein